MRNFDEPLLECPDGHGEMPAAQTSLRVLIIEDDTADLFAIQRLLRKSTDRAVEVAHVNDYDSAITALSTVEYDVALVDYFIGKHEASALLKAVTGKILMPAIILTGSDDPYVRQAVLKSSAFDYHDKNTLCGATLMRSIEFAMNRFATEKALRIENDDLRRAFENAEAAHFSKAEFLAFLSCELRTPLNAVLGFSQVMKMQDENMASLASYKQYSEVIHDSGVQLLNLVDDLLDMSETDTDAFAARQHRFKRFRTWIMDKHDIRDAIAPDEKLTSEAGARITRSMVG